MVSWVAAFMVMAGGAAAQPSAATSQPPVQQQGRATLLRSWAGGGDWRVYLVRTGTDGEPSCLMMTGSAELQAQVVARNAPPATMPRVTSPLTPGGPNGNAAPSGAGRAASRGTAAWGFRLINDEVAVFVDDRDASLLDVPLIIVQADGEVVGALPVSERATLESGISSITARVTDPAQRDAVLGLMTIADEISLQLSDRALVAHLDQAGEALRQLGLCRQEARLLAAARRAR